MSLESLYNLVGLSRQSYHTYRHRKYSLGLLELSILKRVELHREEHPKMGARPLHRIMKSNESDKQLLANYGVNKFEKLLLNNGYGVKPKKNYRRTTINGGFWYDNLILELTINELDRVWVSDITYYRCDDKQKFYYLTTILDVYSRRCLGVSWSTGMTAEETSINVLKMALKVRGKNSYEGLIFHTDGGSQYYDKKFGELRNEYGITPSMGRCAYENPFAEKFNDILKNKYLIPWQTYGVELPKSLKRFMRNYNTQKPHQNLENRTPLAFESWIGSLPVEQRPPLLLKDPTKSMLTACR